MKNRLIPTIVKWGSFLGLGLISNLSASPHVPAGIDHGTFDRLLAEYVDERGLIDYAAWKGSESDMAALQDYLVQFAPVPEEAAVGDDKIASLINAYNAFTIEFILENYPVRSIRLLKDPFDGKRHKVGGEWVSVDTIEHEMLRPIIGWKVHSVVVCAAISCPPLLNRAYTPENWREEMEGRYRTWLGREDLNAFDTGRFRPVVQVSRIFDWYAEDYTGDHSVEEVLRRFAPSEYAEFLAGDFRISFQRYHWGLNDQSGIGDGYRHNPLRNLFQ